MNGRPRFFPYCTSFERNYMIKQSNHHQDNIGQQAIETKLVGHQQCTWPLISVFDSSVKEIGCGGQREAGIFPSGWPVQEPDESVEAKKKR